MIALFMVREPERPQSAAAGDSGVAIPLHGRGLGAGSRFDLVLDSTAQIKSNKTTNPDPHSQHQDTQPPADQNLASQIAELWAKIAKLEVGSGMSPGTGGMKPGMPSKKPAMGMMDDTMGDIARGCPYFALQPFTLAGHSAWY